MYCWIPLLVIAIAGRIVAWVRCIREPLIPNCATFLSPSMRYRNMDSRKSDEQELEAFQMTCLRRILGIRLCAKRISDEPYSAAKHL